MRKLRSGVGSSMVMATLPEILRRNQKRILKKKRMTNRPKFINLELPIKNLELKVNMERL